MATSTTAGPNPARRDVLSRRIRLLVAATIAYNLIEAIVALTAGTIASSTALVGFGLDSVIEVCSAAALAWQFSAREHAVRETREKTTLRIIALSFFALAAYVTADAVRTLTGTGGAGHSTPGIVLAALGLIVMPVLSAAQRRAGRELGSSSAVADSKQTHAPTFTAGPVRRTHLRLARGSRLVAEGGLPAGRTPPVRESMAQAPGPRTAISRKAQQNIAAGSPPFCSGITSFGR
jgi:hypothetical protein